MTVSDQLYNEYNTACSRDMYTMHGTVAFYINGRMTTKDDNTHILNIDKNIIHHDFNDFMESAIRVMKIEERYTLENHLTSLRGDEPDSIIKISLCHAGMYDDLHDFIVQSHDMYNYIVGIRWFFHNSENITMDKLARLAHIWKEMYRNHLTSVVAVGINIRTDMNDDDRVMDFVESILLVSDRIPNNATCRKMIGYVISPQYQYEVSSIFRSMKLMLYDAIIGRNEFTPEDCMVLLYLLKVQHDNMITDDEDNTYGIDVDAAMNAFGNMASISKEFGYEQLRSSLTSQNDEHMLS